MRDDGADEVRAAECEVDGDGVGGRYHALIGCNPNRATLTEIAASPLAVESVRHGEVPKARAMERPMIVGVARP